MAAIPRASTDGTAGAGTPRHPAGHARSTCGWAPVLASSATSGCSPRSALRHRLSRQWVLERLVIEPRPGGSPWSIGAGPWHQSEEHFGSH
jgi:hypothetical protein